MLGRIAILKWIPIYTFKSYLVTNGLGSRLCFFFSRGPDGQPTYKEHALCPRPMGTIALRNQVYTRLQHCTKGREL